MLFIKHLVKRYGNFTAVEDLSLTVDEGSIFGFVGPNGAGKTTTMKIMAGLLTASGGSVIIDDVDVTKKTRVLREKIGYMPDFFGVYDNLKVSEYMDFYAGAYYIPYRDRGVIIDSLLETVDLSHKKDAMVDSLSRGMKQRLCLARSLVHDPKLLILDEPASGLDPRARVEMKEVLKQLQTLGKTILISSHILPELAEMCTEIGIIDKGSLVTQGSINEILKKVNKQHIIVARALNAQENLLKALSEQPGVSDVLDLTDCVEFAYSEDDASLSQLLKRVVAQDIPIISFREKDGNLEDIFMQVTEGGRK